MKRRASQAQPQARRRQDSRASVAAGPRRPANKTPEGYLLQSVGKALTFIEFMSREPNGVTLTSASRGLGLSKPTAQRLLATLLRHGWIRIHPQTNRYVLGIRLWEIGCRSIERLGIRDAAQPWMEKLAAETHETVLLSILDDLEVVYINKVVVEQPVQAMAHIGQRAPVYASGSGKALLAHQPREIIEQLRGCLERYTPNTIVDFDRLQHVLADVARQGWAMNDEEWRAGVRSVAAPIRDSTGKVVAAVGVAGPAYRVDRSRVASLAGTVKDCAASISRELGYLGRDMLPAEGAPGSTA